MIESELTLARFADSSLDNELVLSDAMVVDDDNFSASASFSVPILGFGW